MYKAFRGWERDIGILPSLTELIYLAKNAGFNGVEVDIREVAKLADEKGINYVRDLFTEANIVPAGWALGLRANDVEENYRKGLAELPRLAELGRQIGATRAVGGISPFSDEYPFKENFEWLTGRFRLICKILKEHGCCLSLEYLTHPLQRAGHKYEFIYTTKDALEFCDAVGTDNIGLLFDTWWWYIAGETVEDIKDLTYKQVNYCHISDGPKGVSVKDLSSWNPNLLSYYQHGKIGRPFPGETGVIDLIGCLKILEKIGYDGPVMPEIYVGSFSRKVPADKAGQMDGLLEAARTLRASLDKLWLKAGLAY